MFDTGAADRPNRPFALALAFVLLTPWLAARAQANPPQASPYPREFGYVTLSDGVRLAYVAYRPSQEGKFPTIMQYDPYVAAGSGPSARSPAWPRRPRRGRGVPRAC